ncbi:unnamed protein product [Didymodactylos carnosus]|uniref:Uncharacterized protein n=1 Tax=Didymodactylos carnosus TaxID=1234261 RepID=A0A813S5S6_9BILA|nr:unnamed protein product [Didymodactylos carnosus]CAF3574735.1 unnamed protein product [Didymodactylos carnosus]
MTVEVTHTAQYYPQDMQKPTPQVYHITGERPVSTSTQSPVTMRALVTDPERYKPVANHAPPSHLTKPTQPVTMYTLDTYHPIVHQPLQSDPRVFYIESNQKALETLEEHDPKPIPQLYTVIGKPIEPNTIHETQPVIARDIEPTLFSIMGHPVAQTIVDEVPVITREKEPLLYDISGDSNNIPTATENIEPTLYSIVSSPTFSKTILPVTHSIRTKEPVLYSVTGQPRYTYNIQDKNSEYLPQVPIEAMPDKTATLYSIVGTHSSVHLPSSLQSKSFQPKKQSAVPNLYTTIGGPQQTSPLKQPKSSLDYEQNPVLYSIMGQPKVPLDVKKYTRKPESQDHNQSHYREPTKENIPPHIYTVVGEPRVPAFLKKHHAQENTPAHSVVRESKLPAIKNKNQLPQENILTYAIIDSPKKPPIINATTIPLTGKQSVVKSHIPSVKKNSTLYSVVGHPETPVIIPSRPVKQTRTPREPANSEPRNAIRPLRRYASIEPKPSYTHQPVKEPEEVISHSVINHYPRKAAVRKPEKMIILYPVEQKPRQVLSERNPVIEHHVIVKHKELPPKVIHNEPKFIEQKPLRYVYRTQKPFQSREQNHTIPKWPKQERSLPRIIRKPTRKIDRGLVHQPKFKPTERYPAGVRRRWDYISHRHDGDNDDDDNNNNGPKRKRPRYDRVPRPRTPWLPVWR